MSDIPNPEGSEAVDALWTALLQLGQRVEGRYAAPDLIALLKDAGWALVRSGDTPVEAALRVCDAQLAEADAQLLALREAIQFGDDKARMAALTDTQAQSDLIVQRIKDEAVNGVEIVHSQIRAEARAEERERIRDWLYDRGLSSTADDLPLAEFPESQP